MYTTSRRCRRETMSLLLSDLSSFFLLSMLPLHLCFAAMDDGDRPQCTCEKTECLRRYCRCFDTRWYCSDECTCRGCRNVEENGEEVEERVENIRRKKPGAFTRKIDAAGSVVTGKKEAMVHVKGCNCRKSGCKKLYCECHRHEVGCSARCRCTGCANTYGAKGASETDKVKVDGNGNGSSNEIVFRDSQFSSLPASEEDQQKINDNVSPNGTYIGSQSSSLPEFEADRQKVNDSTSPNETSGGPQSSSLPACEEQKVNNVNDIYKETSRGSGEALAGSNGTSSLFDDEIFYSPTEKIFLGDFHANHDSSCAADLQPLDENIFDDIFHQFLGDGDGDYFQHSIGPQTFQGSAQVDESPLKTYQGSAQADESQLETYQEIVQPDESQLQTYEGSAQADESLLNNAKGSSNLQSANVHNASQNNTREGD